MYLKNSRIISIFFGVFWCLVPVVVGQNSIKGKVTDKDGNELSGVNVFIENLSKGTTTNTNGNYVLKNIPQGSYTIHASFVGLKKLSKTINTDNDTVVNFKLYEEFDKLNEVVLKSTVTKLQESVYAPSILSAKKLRLKATPLVAMLGELSGVRIREQGGMGSTANIMVNGISGKGIGVFVDYIPISLLGKNFQLHQIPPSLIKSVEVYKGITPVAFGSDALGGVINIGTRNSHTSYLDASYTLGSWNTHLASVNTKQFLDKKDNLFIELNASLNYSDNNYKMYNVPILVDTLGNTKTGKARRFNDQYKSQTLKTSIGTQEVKWADSFKASIILNNTYKEWQHGITANRPWGEVFSKSNSFNSYVTWKKAFANNQWQLQGVVGYNYMYERFTDTVAKAYFWDGNYVNKASKGESGFYVNGRTPKIKNKNVFGRFLANRILSKKHTLNITSLLSYESIKGTDKAGMATFEVDFYTQPQKFSKLFVGASLESKFLNTKLSNTFSLKYYRGASKVANLDVSKIFIKYLKNAYGLLGYGNITKYSFSDKLYSFLGYEYTIRLPDSDELFGDGISIAPNAHLEAERSHNINLGINFKTSEEKLNMNLMGFYRNVNNQIFLRALNMAQSSYLNLHQTSTLGIESSLQYKPHNRINLGANFTLFKQKLEDIDEYGYLKKRYKGTRIPNTPYLFANGWLTYTTDKQKLAIEYSTNYVKSFFVSWESDGTKHTKAKVPSQFIHNTSVSYNMLKNKLSISFECRNLLNKKVYDNYSVQKPGRSLYLKTRFFIN